MEHVVDESQIRRKMVGIVHVSNSERGASAQNIWSLRWRIWSLRWCIAHTAMIAITGEYPVVGPWNIPMFILVELVQLSNISMQNLKQRLTAQWADHAA